MRAVGFLLGVSGEGTDIGGCIFRNVCAVLTFEMPCALYARAAVAVLEVDMIRLQTYIHHSEHHACAVEAHGLTVVGESVLYFIDFSRGAGEVKGGAQLVAEAHGLHLLEVGYFLGELNGENGHTDIA